MLRELLDGLRIAPAGDSSTEEGSTGEDSWSWLADPRALLDRARGEELRTLIDRARHGELLRIGLGDERWALVERMQSTMSLIEGHAEHTMDAVGAEFLPSLPRLRAAMTRRRGRGPGAALARARAAARPGVEDASVRGRPALLRRGRRCRRRRDAGDRLALASGVAERGGALRTRLVAQSRARPRLRDTRGLDAPASRPGGHPGPHPGMRGRAPESRLREHLLGSIQGPNTCSDVTSLRSRTRLFTGIHRSRRPRVTISSGRVTNRCSVLSSLTSPRTRAM